MKIFNSMIYAYLFAVMVSGIAHAVEPDLVEINDADLTQVVMAVLTHKEVSMYLHPNMPGRLPVVIAMAHPYSYREIKMELFGEPIVITTNPKDLKKAVKLRIKCTENKCTVSVEYDPEGIFGDVLLLKESEWKVTSATIYE